MNLEPYIPVIVVALGSGGIGSAIILFVIDGLKAKRKLKQQIEQDKIDAVRKARDIELARQQVQEAGQQEADNFVRNFGFEGLKELREQNEKIEAENAEIRQQNAEEKAEIDEMRQSQQLRMVQIGELQIQSNENQRRWMALSEDNGKLHMENDTLKKDIEELKGKYDMVVQENSAKDNVIMALNSTVESVKKERDAAQEKADRAQALNDAIMAKLSQMGISLNLQELMISQPDGAD